MVITWKMHDKVIYILWITYNLYIIITPENKAHKKPIVGLWSLGK